MMDTLTAIAQKIEFIREIDALKGVLRKSYLLDESRLENSAEHSWHSTMLALVMVEHANQEVDLLKVLKMQLIHDVVEVDAGDVLCYDTKGHEGKYERELAAAKRIFGLLPAPHDTELLELWIEFETGDSAEAKFCNACDRLIPLIHNHGTQGRAWQENGIVEKQVRDRNAKIANGSADLWTFTDQLIADAVEKGYLPK